LKNETRSKILGLLLFVGLTIWIVYLAFAVQRPEVDEKIKSITITGNSLLNENDYLTFAKLNGSEIPEDVTLPIIKSRLEKHPYIQRADVEFTGNNEVHINLNEKKIKAVLVSDNELFLATQNFEILPFLQNTKILNMPVVTNLSNDILLKKNEILKTPGLVEAFKIMDAAELTGGGLSKTLSEINLRKGGDIILLFSGIKPPVILGKGNTAAKIYVFNQLVNNDDADKAMVMNSSYVDLRFNNEIFLGNYDKTDLTE
jgi:cell division protein FtsQ